MSRYIDADYVLVEAENVFSDLGDYGWLKRIFENPSAPSIEPKRGEWIVHKARTEVNDGFIDFFPTEYECSNCGLKQSMYFINSKPSNFCPNCGADMREREGE